jgi:hypothetical protein
MKNKQRELEMILKITIEALFQQLPSYLLIEWSYVATLDHEHVMSCNMVDLV